MKNTIFKGMATAIVTPMTKDGIDYEALGRFLEFQIENGINAIVVMGTTGLCRPPLIPTQEHWVPLAF